MIGRLEGLSRFAPMGVGFVGLAFGQILLARAVTPEVLGEYSLVLAWVGALAILCLAGYHLSVIKLLPPNIAQSAGSSVRFLHRQSVSAVVRRSLLCVGIALLFFVPGMPTLPGMSQANLVYAIVLVPLLCFTQLRFAVASAWEHHWHAHLPDNVFRPLLIIAALYLVGHNGTTLNVTILLCITVTTYAFVTVFSTLALRKQLPHLPENRFDPNTLETDLVSVARYTGGVNLTIAVMKAIELLIVGTLVSPAELAGYVVVTRMVEMTNFIYFMLDPVYFPKFARLSSKVSRNELGRVARSYSRICSCWSLVTLILFAATGEWLLGLFGASYSAYWGILMFATLGQVANAVTGAGAQLLTLGGQERLNFWSTLAVASLYVIVLVIMTSAYGLAGAAVSLVGYQLIRGIAQAYLVRTHQNILIYPFARNETIG